MRDLEQTLLDVVRKTLRTADVASVTVSPSSDLDDTDVVNVAITLRSAAEDIDPAALVSLVRHLRNALEKRKDTRFPLISFPDPMTRGEPAAA